MVLKTIRVALATLMLSLASFAAVVVDSPASGSTVTSPVHVVASDINATGMEVWVDYNKVYAGDGTSIDQNINMTQGTHRLVVQSRNKNGLLDKQVMSIDVADSGYSHVTTDIEEHLPWATCGNCGNTGATGHVASPYQTKISAPSLDGASTKFGVHTNYGYTNVYWYVKAFGDSRVIHRMAIDYDLWVPSEFERTPQALEFETQQRHSNYLYNMAMQCGYSNGMWRTFDYINQTWKSLGIKCTPFQGDTWYHVRAEFTLDYASHTRTFVALTITPKGGTAKRYTATQNATQKAKSQSGENYMTYASFQLDTDKYGTDYYVILDNYSFMWE